MRLAPKRNKEKYRVGQTPIRIFCNVIGGIKTRKNGPNLHFCTSISKESSQWESKEKVNKTFKTLINYHGKVLE